MSIMYCHECGKNIDTDYDAEHFIDSECAVKDNKENHVIRTEEIRHGIKQLVNCEDGSFAQADWLTTLDIKLDELKDQVRKMQEEAVRGFAEFTLSYDYTKDLNQPIEIYRSVNEALKEWELHLSEQETK